MALRFIVKFTARRGRHLYALAFEVVEPLGADCLDFGHEEDGQVQIQRRILPVADIAIRMILQDRMFEMNQLLVSFFIKQA